MNLHIPEGTEKISAGAYLDMRTLDSVTIPDSVKEIGDRAFEGCDYLEELVIPASVERIGRNVCSGCMRLKRFVMLGTAAFDRSWLNGCRSLEQIELSPESGVTVWNGAVYNPDLTELIFVPSGLKHLILPPTVETADISAKIEELSFYAYQQISVETFLLTKLHLYTEQKQYSVYIPDEEEIDFMLEDIPALLEYEKLINDVISVLQTGEFPEKFGLALFETPSYCREYLLSLFALRFELTEIIAELYQKDWKEICCEQTRIVIEDMVENLEEETLCQQLNVFFCSHVKYLFCLDAFPEWKKEVLKELICIRKPEAMENLLEKYDFTESEIDFMLKAANGMRKYEIQLLLMHYRREKFGYGDITEKLKL